jgi:hypothetical protein
LQEVPASEQTARALRGAARERRGRILMEHGSMNNQTG